MMLTKLRYILAGSVIAIMGSAVYWSIAASGSDNPDHLSVQARIDSHKKSPVLTEKFVSELAQIKEYSSIYEWNQFVTYFQNQRLYFTGEIYSVREDYILSFNDYQGLKKNPYYAIHLISRSLTRDLSLFCYVPRTGTADTWPEHIRKGETITVSGMLGEIRPGKITKLDPCELKEKPHD